MRTLIAVLLVALGLAAGCQARPRAAEDKAPAPGSASAAEGERLLIDPTDAHRLGFLPVWTTHLAVPAGNRVTTRVWLGDQVLAVEEPESLLTAVSSKDGSVVFHRHVARRTSRLHKPFLVGADLFVNSETHLYHLDRREGTTLNYYRLDTVTQAPPAVVGTDAVFGGGDGRVFAMATATGHITWRYDMPQGIIAPPTAIGAQVFVADTDGNYALLDSEAGELLWKERAYQGIVAAPARDAQTVYVASLDQKVYAVNVLTGKDHWNALTSEPLTASPVVLGDLVFVRVPGKETIAYDADSGQVLWRTDEEVLALWRDAKGVLAHGAQRLLWLEPTTGRVLSEADTVPLDQVLVGPEGALILVDRQNRMVRLDPRR